MQSWAAFHQRQGPKDTFIAGLETVQALLPETGFAVGEWSIADAAVAPFLGRAEVALQGDLGSWEKGVGPETYKEVFESERFARIVKYWRDNEARESWKKTWNEVRSLLIGRAKSRGLNIGF